MSHHDRSQDTDPKDERARIGTPAGESAEEGRKRHGTKCLTDYCRPPEEVRSRRTVGEDISDEDFTDKGEEIAPTGGLTGKHVKGGIPAGGSQAGGTPNEPRRQVLDDGSEG